MDPRIDAYNVRARQHATARDAQDRRSVLIARLRLATFLPGIALLLWALAGGRSVPFAVAGVLFAVFGVLVVRHARVDERRAWYEALRTVNARSVARLARQWEGLPGGELPASLQASDQELLAHHPYALDLDILGHASLFHWLGPAATSGGAATLAGWLLAPAARDDVVARQHAVREAAPLAEWREQFSARGVLASAFTASRIEGLLAWAESTVPLVPGGLALRVTVRALTALIWVTFFLWLAGSVPAGAWIAAALPGIVISFVLVGPVYAAFDRAGAGERALSGYAGLFEHAASHQFTNRQLAELQARLSAGGMPAYVCMQRLGRILGFSELRRSAAIFHFLIQALTLWDFHVVFALDRWRRGAGPRVRGWMTALGEMDAILMLAAVKHDYPGWAFPSIDDRPTMVAKGVAHPLIADERRVANDVEVGPPGTLLLVTGSNMSGKSTLLRAVGINVVLANAGSCVCADEMTLPSVDLQASIRVQDSLELGLSYFMAALARLKGVVDSAEHERPGRVLLYLLDEILQGTNSAERSIAVRAVARHLLDAGAIGAMTSHDLTLAEEEPLKTAARLVHFTEIVTDRDEMTFDYRLRPGIATSRNALRLMKMIGIDV